MKTEVNDLPQAIRSLLESETVTDILETILTDAATQAVKDRVWSAYKGIYKGKFVDWFEPRPYDMEELTEGMTFMLDPESRVRGFSDRDNAVGRAPSTSWSDIGNAGGDTRKPISDDNMDMVLEASTLMIKSITIESLLAKAGIEAITTSQEQLDACNNWRRNLIARNKRDEIVNDRINTAKSKEAVASMSEVLSTLK